MKIIAADHVLPISSAPIRNGAVAIDGAEIAAVGPRDDLVTRFSTAEVEDHGAAAIVPGFVNCHSHLELTAFRGALDDVEYDFTAWLLKLNGLRAAMSPDEVRDSAELGAREGARAGITCFADIGRIGSAGMHALKQTGLRGIVYQETEFSADNRTADDDHRKLVETFDELRVQATDLVGVGLSPHSPYTVGSKLFEMIAEFAILDRVPLTIHAAESADEHELLTCGTGFFTTVYEKFGVDWQSPRCTAVEYLERLGVLAARPLLAHCVTVSESDLARIRSSGASIAHCPRSNAKLGHGYAPFESMLDAGIAVGLGSDSVVSNNSCDILEESRFAALVARNRAGSRRFLSARDVLKAATIGGARALGLDHLVGTLDVGKQADIAVISLSAPAQQPVNEIESTLVFSSGGRDVIRTIVAGSTVFTG